MTITDKLANAIKAVEDTLAHHKAIYTNGKALTARSEAARNEFMIRIQTTSGDGHPLNINRGHPEVEVVLGLDSTTRFLAVDAIARSVTGSPEYIEAAAILEPLIAEVASLQVELEAEQAAAALVAAARKEAIEVATAEALASVEARFAIDSPEPELEPVKPFRGRGLKPALSNA